jgi:hypothetical protein
MTYDLEKVKVSGYVTSENGILLKGAKVSCNEYETTTLADGYYDLVLSTQRKYDVKVTLLGFISETKTVFIEKDEIVNLDFCLSRDVGNSSIVGHIFDIESNDPISVGSVILILPIFNRYADITEGGRYEFSKMPAGTYKLLTSIQDYQDYASNISIKDNETITHDIFCKNNKIVEPAWG